MNRVDRLTAILLLLQGGKRTAGELAERFELSRRTILRDIDALCEIGIPVVAETGSAGGYSLPPDYSLPPLALTFHEALLLHLALNSLIQLPEIPFKEARDSLQAKVQTLIPQHTRSGIASLEQKLLFNVPPHSYPTPFLDLFVESTQLQQWLQVTYHSERGVSEQTILPLRLRALEGLWYCMAYSLKHQEHRRYRVDRFLAVKKALQPPMSTLPDTSASFFGDDSLPEVHIELTARGAFLIEHDPFVRIHLQRREDGSGWLRGHFRLGDYDWLVRTLLSLGMEAKVLAPESLQQLLRQQLALLTKHHMGDTTL